MDFSCHHNDIFKSYLAARICERFYSKSVPTNQSDVDWCERSSRSSEHNYFVNNGLINSSSPLGLGDIHMSPAPSVLFLQIRGKEFDLNGKETDDGRPKCFQILKCNTQKSKKALTKHQNLTEWIELVNIWIYTTQWRPFHTNFHKFEMSAKIPNFSYDAWHTACKHRDVFISFRAMSMFSMCVLSLNILLYVVLWPAFLVCCVYIQYIVVSSVIIWITRKISASFHS